MFSQLWLVFLCEIHLKSDQVASLRYVKLQRTTSCKKPAHVHQSISPASPPAQMSSSPGSFSRFCCVFWAEIDPPLGGSPQVIGYEARKLQQEPPNHSYPGCISTAVKVATLQWHPEFEVLGPGRFGLEPGMSWFLSAAHKLVVYLP